MDTIICQKGGNRINNIYLRQVLDMIHFAEVGLGESEWMKDFDLAFGLMLNASLFPAEAQILFGMAGEGSAEWMKDLSVRLGEKVVQELGKKVTKDAAKKLIEQIVKEHIKKDGAAFFRGMTAQFIVSSFMWAAEESEKGHRITSDDYLKMIGVSDDSDVFNWEYGNIARDFWIGVIQAGCSNVTDAHFRGDNTKLNCLLTFFEDVDFSRIVSGLIDKEFTIKDVIYISFDESLKRVLPAMSDCVWKYIQDKINISQFDSGAQA